MLRNIVLLLFFANVLGKGLEIPQVESVFQNLKNQRWEEDEISCRNKIFDLLDNVKNSTLWASWVWDSIQQAPLGTFYGSRYNLGNYDQCLRPPWLTSNPELRMQYCLAEIRMDKVGLKKKDPVSPYASSDEYLLESITDFGRIFSDFWYGVCLPAECPPSSIDKFVRALMNTSHLRPARDAEVIINHCEVAGAKHEYPPGFYGYIYTFAALLFMAVASTYYLIEYPMTAGPDTFANHLAKSFCLRRNWATVFKQDKDALTSLHGIRFLTAVIIVFIHQLAFLQGNSLTNALDFESVTKKYVQAVPIVHFDLYVDSFFAMAALLLGKTLATLDVSKPKDVLKSILKRYIRLIGPFAVTVLYLVHVSMHTDDGPLYQRTAKFEQQACEKNWWLALLMVGNYINTSEMCHPATWYIPCDFHFYVITIILLYVYRKNPSAGKTAAAIVLFFGFIGPAVSTWVYDLPAVIAYNLGSDINIRRSKNFIHGYIRTHNRMGPYVMGLIVGYLMSVYKPAEHKKIWSKTVSFLGAMASLGIMGAVLVTGLLCYQYGVEGILACLFMTFNRTVFAISVLGIIVFCTYGDVPLINSLLSWSVFAPVSRLSYGVYVIHLLILYRGKISLRSSAKFHIFESVVESFGLVMISLLLSLTVWLLVEAPLINFSNRYLSTKSASKDKVVYANGSPNNTNKIK